MDSPDSPLSSRADPAAWPTWWRYNRDAYLDLKRIVRGLETRTGSDGFSLGAGQREKRIGGLRETTVHTQVLPALQRTLRGGGSFELIRSSLLAMARVESSWGTAEGTTIEFVTRFYLTEEGNQETAEAAIVAMGVRADPAAAPTLIELLLDTDAGRELCDGEPVDYRRRALAAYSLGLIGRANDDSSLRRDIAMALIANLEDNAFAPYDTQLAALVALGLVPMDACQEPEGETSTKEPADHFCRGRQLSLLLDYMVDQRRHTRLRAHAAVPLARLTASARERHRTNVTEWLLHLVQPRSKEAPEVKQGAVIALGLLGDSDDDMLDVELRKSLTRIEKSGDRLASPLALIALARVAGRPGNGENDGEARADVQELLLQKMARGRNGADGWAAVALGVFAHTMAEHQQVVSDDVAQALRAKMARSGKSEDIAAPCIGLGLLRDGEAGEVLLRRLERSKNDLQRSSAALALGLVGAEQARDPMVAFLEDAESESDLFRSLSLGLRLLGDRSIVGRLVEVASETDDDGVRASLYLALGALGDAAAIAPLVAVLDDPRISDDVRASAARALGELCDTAPRPWSQPISSDLHHAVLSSTLVSYTDTGTGLLDMR